MTNKQTRKTSSQKIKDQAYKGAKKLLDQIPKAVEKSPFLQNTLTMIVEMQQQAKSIRKDANEEVHKLLEVLHHSYGDFETKAKSAGTKAKKQAQEGIEHLLVGWEKKKGALPKKFATEMDSLLKRVGLIKSTKKAAPSTTKKKATVKKTVRSTKSKATSAKKAPAKKSPAKKAKASAKSNSSSSALKTGSSKNAPTAKKPAKKKKLVIRKVNPPVLP